jgi:hypothetical protein
MFTFFLFIIFQNSFAQTNGSIEFSFKDSSEGKVNLYTTVSLEKDSLVSKLSLEVYNIQSNELMYNVTYSVNTSPFVNAQGLVLFERKSNKYLINSDTEIPFANYSFKVYIEDLNGLKSEVILDIK